MFLPVSLEYAFGLLLWLAVAAGAFIGLLKARRKRRNDLVKLRWIHVGLSLWMFVALLTACEIGFALFVDHSDSFNMTNISKRWFDLHVDRQRNAFGARDLADFEKRVPEGKRRICFVGDSFTIGHGIDDLADRFSDRVALGLEKQSPGKYLVANLGDPGLEISQIESRVHGILKEGYQIDTVIYVMCLNDIEAYDPKTKEVIAKLQRAEPRFFLFRKTYFFNWLYFRIVQFTQPEVSQYFPHLKQSFETEAWDLFQRHLDDLHRYCSSYNADLRVVIFPFIQELGPNYSFRDAHRKMVDYCSKEGIPVLDLEPVLSSHVAEKLTVNRYDAHPNERAHEIAAAAILSQLLDDISSGAERRQ